MTETPCQTLEIFSPLVGDAFTLPFDNGTNLELVLCEASALPTHDFPGRTRDPFQLKFKGCQDFVLPQQIYHMLHPILASVSIFIVPVGKEQDGYIYQAVFN
jgi:hypothetical protein